MPPAKVQLYLDRGPTDGYDYLGEFHAGSLVAAIKSCALAEGEHEVFALWPGEYGKRFRVTVPKAEAVIEELA